jgi:hypothetical protein
MAQFTITKVTRKTRDDGQIRFSIKIRREISNPILGNSTRTYYFTTDQDRFKENELLDIEIKDFNIREFEYTIPDSGKTIKLKALAHKE